MRDGQPRRQPRMKRQHAHHSRLSQTYVFSRCFLPLDDLIRTLFPFRRRLSSVGRRFLLRRIITLPRILCLRTTIFARSFNIRARASALHDRLFFFRESSPAIFHSAYVTIPIDNDVFSTRNVSCMGGPVRTGCMTGPRS